MAKMTLHELMTNPTGPGGGFLAARYQIIDNLNRRFNEMATVKDFRYAVYKRGNRTVFHVQVPTESEEREFHWDVIVEVATAGTTAKAILGSHVRVFSNAPSFVFTYGWVADHEDMLVKWLKKKIPPKVFRKAPDVRNLIRQMGFEKTVYFACRWILTRDLYDPVVEPPDALKQADIERVVEGFDRKMEEYRKLKKVAALARKRAKRATAAQRDLEVKRAKEANKIEANIVSGRVLSRTSTRAKSARKTSTVKKAKRARTPKKR